LAGVAAVGVLGVGGVALWRRAKPPLASSDGRVAIAVLPFRATVASAGEWSEAVPDLLTTALDGTPGIRVVDPWSLWRTLRSQPTSAPRAPDPSEAARLAERAGASCYMLGSITQLQGRVEISVRVYRRGNDEPWQTLSVSGTSDSIAAVVQRLAIDVIRRVSNVESSTSLAAFDHGLTRSPDALKAWLSARELQRRGRVDSADIAIQKALTADSMFAFAMVDAVQIRSWLQFMRGQMYAGLLPLAERAVRLSDSLPERQRLRAIASLASIRTEGARSAEALERIIAIDSSDVEAWGHLSYVDLDYGWQFGRGEKEALAAAERALHFDSTDVTILSRLTGISVASNDDARLDDLLRRLRHLDTTISVVRGDIRSIEAVRANDAQFTQVLDRMRTAPITEWVSVLRAVRSYRADRAEMINRRLYESTEMASRRIGLGSMVQVFAAEGQWGAIDSLRQAGAFSQVPDLARTADRLTTAAAIAGVTGEPTARRAVTALASTLPPDSARAWFMTRQVWLEGWLIAGWHAMYGDTVLARRWHAALGTLPKGGSPPEYASALRADIDSRLAARRGDRRTALADAGRALELWSIHTSNTLELMPEPAMRFQLAMLLRAAGNTDSAAALFRSLVPPTTWQGFYTARAALELGELADARGDRVYAEREFLTALRLWERGDSSVAPFRERARRGVARDRS
jgi:tetratricopeptide (TPR) repeat protein